MALMSNCARPRLRTIARATLVLALVACGSSPSNLAVGSTLPPDLTLGLDLFATGLSNPVFLTAPMQDGRVFIVEQAGRIRVVRDGELQAAPLLDISSRVGSGGERGLLSVAFHPRYAANHFFYVYFTAPNGEIRIERFTTSADPDIADPATSKVILSTPHSNYSNHNGGLASFGPDGFLYLGLGDGGGGGDPLGSGQNFNTLLGSLLRIDVDGGDPYSVPPDNPFVGQAGRRGEVWAKGLRNPWRYAFDVATERLYVADVGQSQREEVSVVPANRPGVNYGWNVMEGSRCYNAATCAQTGLTLPVLDYDHTIGCSITGGYVYRGSAIPELHGHYFYSDYCSGWLKSFRFQNGAAADLKDWELEVGPVTSFGQDASGELYVLSGSTAHRLVRGS